MAYYHIIIYCIIYNVLLYYYISAVLQYVYCEYTHFLYAWNTRMIPELKNNKIAVLSLSKVFVLEHLPFQSPSSAYTPPAP